MAVTFRSATPQAVLDGRVLTCARSCLRRGDADARITRFPLIEFNAGRSRGNGSLGRGGPGGPLAAGADGDASV